jgi:hypothetical protein
VPATTGPPKSAEIAENEPAVPSTRLGCSPTFVKYVTASPTIEPIAISGASGPSTAPNESVPIAASAIPGASRTRTGAPPMPSMGGLPPSPGRKRRAT